MVTVAFRGCGWSTTTASDNSRDSPALRHQAGAGPRVGQSCKLQQGQQQEAPEANPPVKESAIVTAAAARPMPLLGPSRQVLLPQFKKPGWPDPEPYQHQHGPVVPPRQSSSTPPITSTAPAPTLLPHLVSMPNQQQCRLNANHSDKISVQ